MCVRRAIGKFSRLRGKAGKLIKEKDKAPELPGLLGSFVLCMRTGETVRCPRW
jgi:hypothetical protein